MRMKKITAVIISVMMIIITAMPAAAVSDGDTVVIYHTNDVHGY
jgi:hypothetical protein